LIPDTPGNNRMMRGYISTLNDTITSVLVDNLPDEFTRNGYDVYVYVDGDTGLHWRTGRYAIGPAAIWAENHRPFQGTSQRALAGSEGNYVVFPGLPDRRFVLTATPGPSFDQNMRAPINGIQIVARAGQ